MESIVRFDSSTGAFETFVNPSGDFINGMVLGSDGVLYVAVHDDFASHEYAVHSYDVDTGALVDVVATSDTFFGHIAFDGDGILYACGNDNVYRYNESTDSMQEFVVSGSGGLITSSVGEMSFGPDGNLYISSRGADVFAPYSVLRYDGPTGAFIDAVVSSDNSRLARISYLAFDNSDNLYVSGSKRDEVHRFGPTGQAALTVSLSRIYDEPVTVDYATNDGTATAVGGDYTGSAARSSSRQV